MMKKLVIINMVLLMMSAKLLWGQSDLIMINRTMERTLFNPATSYEKDNVMAMLGAHQQWIGFEDAPSMQWAMLTTSLQRIHSGLGFEVLNAVQGVNLTQYVKVNYQYEAVFNERHYLFLGVGAGIYYRQTDYSRLRFDEPEVNINNQNAHDLRPDFSAGLEYQYKSLTVGLAANHLTTSQAKSSLSAPPIQWLSYLQYSVSLGESSRLLTAVSTVVSGRIMAPGMSLDLCYLDRLEVGAKYVVGQSFVIRAGLRIQEMLEIRYAYDMGAGGFQTYNSGVHEFVLIGRFPKRASSFYSPRFLDQ